MRDHPNMKYIDILRNLLQLIVFEKLIKLFKFVRRILLIRIELRFLTPIRRKYLLIILVKVPFIFFIILSVLALDVEEIGIFDLFIVVLNIINILRFIIVCFLHSFLLIPSVIIRIINKKPYSFNLAWES